MMLMFSSATQTSKILTIEPDVCLEEGFAHAFIVSKKIASGD